MTGKPTQHGWSPEALFNKALLYVGEMERYAPDDWGTKSVKLPPRSPNLNSFAERFVRTIKESCLERMILFGERSLRTAVREFVAHYHSERNHEGIGNLLIFPDRRLIDQGGPVRCRSRLGGMLNYDRAA